MKKTTFLFWFVCALLIKAQAPFSKFNANVTATNTVTFSSVSTGNPSSFSWEFSGGTPSVSTSKNPDVTYSSPGVYTAKLTVSNADGNSVSTRTVKVLQGQFVDLRSGSNADGTLMSDAGAQDPDWLYTDPNGVTSVPVTRYTATAAGWSTAILTDGGGGISRWITGNNIITGYHYYVSKEFEIPQGVTTAVLNLRSLSFVRNWTYLVKKNTDGTETETQITATTWFSDGAKGWLNSRSPEVLNYPLSPGKYYIKVRAYTNSGGQRQAIDVNANVKFGTGFSFEFSPLPEFSATPSSTIIGGTAQFTNLTQGSPVSVSWKFGDGTNDLTSTASNPSISFSNVGKHYAEFSGDYGNALLSSLRVDNYVDVIADVDYTKAPNSYIFYKDGILPDGKKVDGLYIPVKKAYAMWKMGRYMENGAGVHTPINNNGTQSASVYWEDVNGLIESATIEGTGEDAKIKVLVNKAKGEGNASIAFKVDGVIYWTWHVWVTDNPENGSSYGQGFETDIQGKSFTPQYMDRNLGATNASFLGNDWHKSGGLMYTWGRKDPFPPLVYKDGSFYEITGEVGSMRHKNAAIASSVIPIKSRGTDTGTNSINGNIRYSINNPINMVVHELNDGTWFSNQEYKTANSDTSLVETWDLWSDNRKGLNSNFNSSNQAVAADSKSYELKSEFDPCPNGWRIPSHYGRNVYLNSSNPFGRKNSGGIDDDGAYSDIDPVNKNPVLDGVKVYPGLGIDFRNVPSRDIGIIPMSGNYEYYGGSNVVFQDQLSESEFATSTYGLGGFRNFRVISDAARLDVSPVGSNKIFIKATGKTVGAIAARCMRDPNVNMLPIEYATNYIPSSETDNTDYKSWTKEPNSYIVMTGDAADASAVDKVLKISLKKAYAMQKLYLSDNKEIPSGNMKTGSVVWTSDASLIKSVKISGSYPDEYLEVTLAAKQKGNAVVAFHKGDNGVWGTSNPDKIMWSWHIWAPITNPLDEANQITYTTESLQNGGVIQTTSGYFIDPTKSLGFPLTTTFMDRNLGALETFPINSPIAYNSQITALLPRIGNSGGLHYQWGRKDPMPTFTTPGGVYSTVVYKQSDVDAQGNVIYDMTTPITESIFSSTNSVNGYSREWNTYKPSATGSKNEKIRQVIKYATENPLSFMFRNKTGSEEGVENSGSLPQKTAQVKDWISDENGQAQDRWGHATEKSPYDPCPSGWRVPDTSTTTVFGGAKGNSPWFYNGYNGGVGYKNYGIGQGIAGLTEKDINNTQTEYKYPGFAVIRYTAPASRLGFVFSFSGSEYNIGNIPVTGIRGILGGNTYDDALWGLYKNNRYRTGLWTSSPADVYSGYAIALDLYSVSTTAGQNGRLATGIGRYPQAAMGVRCAKDTERYMGDLPYTINNPIPAEVNNKMNRTGMIVLESKNEIEVYPNPAKDYLHINNDDDISYEIFDISGKIVQKGEVSNKKINITNLLKGIYLVRFINNNNVIFVKKVIKE